MISDTPEIFFLCQPCRFTNHNYILMTQLMPGVILYNRICLIGQQTQMLQSYLHVIECKSIFFCWQNIYLQSHSDCTVYGSLLVSAGETVNCNHIVTVPSS